MLTCIFLLEINKLCGVICLLLNISNLKSENKHHFKVANVQLYEEMHCICGVHFRVFMSEFYRLHDQNYTYPYSDSHQHDCIIGFTV